jgi:hypothetical protein
MNLKQAVESGKRIRRPQYSDNAGGGWRWPNEYQCGPRGGMTYHLPVEHAIADDWETEPEPEKCCAPGRPPVCEREHGHEGNHRVRHVGAFTEWTHWPSSECSARWVEASGPTHFCFLSKGHVGLHFDSQTYWRQDQGIA